MRAGRMQRSGLVAGAISMTIAIGNLAIFYWVSGFSFLFLGPIAFCASLIAFVHGSWRLASVAGFLSICSSVLAATARRPFYSWQFVLLCGAIGAGFLLGYFLWANYRKNRTFEGQPLAPAWLSGFRRGLGTLLGLVSLTLGLIVWLEFDFGYCSIFDGHVAQKFRGFAPNGREVAMLASGAFLTGATSIGCGSWRLGTLATYASLCAWVALTHSLNDTQVFELFLLTAPLVLFIQPLIVSLVHPLYNPWIAGVLAAILLANWYVRRRRKPAR